MREEYALNPPVGGRSVGGRAGDLVEPLERW